MKTGDRWEQFLLFQTFIVGRLLLPAMPEQHGEAKHLESPSGKLLLFLRSCTSVEHKRPTCCFSASCLLAIRVHGWKESSI